MSEQTTATVETLTAEVRVLMVGNRQITLSVAKQLDVVPLTALDLMGRVRLGGERPTVIGRGPDGALSLAYYREGYREDPVAWIFDGDLPGKILVCEREVTRRMPCGAGASEGLRLTFDGEEIRVWPGAVERCGIPEHRYSAAECGRWSPNGMESAIAAHIAGQAADRSEKARANAEAAKSPLIVLAGLR